MKISKFEQVETKNLVVFFLKKTKKGVLSAPLYTTYEHLASFNNRMVPILRVFSFFILHIFRQITIPTSYVRSSFNFIFFSHVLTSIFVVFKPFFFSSDKLRYLSVACVLSLSLFFWLYSLFLADINSLFLW